MGIDWNETTGTEYSVIGFDPRTGLMYILENFCMEASEHSGEGYKEALKRLHYKWNPKYIYCDYGYGHMLYENLKLESMYAANNVRDNPSMTTPYEKSIAQIGAKLKEVNFSSNLEVYNPATGTYVQKYAKNFLVENAISIFERKKILFAEDDKTLIKQLQNYVVIEKKDNGRIIYGMINEAIGDHRVDAMCLALGGLQLEESVFSYGMNMSEYELTHAPLQKDSPVPDADPGLQTVDGKVVGFKNQADMAARQNPDGTYSFMSAVFKKNVNHEPPNQRSSITGNNKKHEMEGVFEAHGFAKYVPTGDDQTGEEESLFKRKFGSISTPAKIEPRGFGKNSKVRTNI